MTALFLLHGCGGSPSPATTPPPAPESPDAKDERCAALYDHVTDILLRRADPESRRDIHIASEKQRPTFLTSCREESTDEEIACGLAAKNAAELARCTRPGESLRDSGNCSRPEFGGPVILSESLAEQRYGNGIDKFSELHSSRKQPAEVCAVAGSIALLRRLQCDDGSKAFLNDQLAYSSREGSMGPGGRCQSILDLYKVPCPEATYEVWIDMYQCLPGEWPE